MRQPGDRTDRLYANAERGLFGALLLVTLFELYLFVPALYQMPRFEPLAPAAPALSPTQSREQIDARARAERKKLWGWVISWNQAGRSLDLYFPDLPDERWDETLERGIARFNQSAERLLNERRSSLWICSLLATAWLLLIGAALLAPRIARYCAYGITASVLLAVVLSKPVFHSLSPFLTRYHFIPLGLALVLLLVQRSRWRDADETEPRGADGSIPAAPASDLEPRRPAAEQPATPPSLWGLLNGFGFFFLKFGGSAAVTYDLDLQRDLTAVALTGVRHSFWQYQNYNILLFKLGDTQYLYVPPDAGEGRTPVRSSADVRVLVRVPARAWEPGPSSRPPDEHYASCFAAVRSSLFAALPEEVVTKLDRFGPEVDLAPYLHDDLRRIVAGADQTTLARTLTILDLLAAHEGYGSDEFRPRPIWFGTDAVGVLSEHLATVPQEMRGALQEYAPGTEQSRRQHKVVAVLQQTTRFDSTVGGYRAIVALVGLTVADSAWRYERAVVWSHIEEGVEMS